MSGIRGKDTKIEVTVRKALFARGFRYRLHDPRLPGKPDLVFPRYRAVVFVHGCYWHGHECRLFRLPATNTAFWQAKIDGNRVRDMRTRQCLLDAGWRVCVVWECALRGSARLEESEAIRRIAEWLADPDPPAEMVVSGVDQAALTSHRNDVG